jgi:hypothetical protein
MIALGGAVPVVTPVELGDHRVAWKLHAAAAYRKGFCAPPNSQLLASSLFSSSARSDALIRSLAVARELRLMRD